MRLERLELAGFNHFTEPFRLDLRDLPHGLIAVVGPNGAGKTTSLDAPIAALFGPGQKKAFPSRDGTLATYATEKTAYIDALWLLDGRGLVRTRVNVDGVRRKTDAVIEEIGPDGVARPVNASGLIDDYAEAVKERFPSLRSILASAYAAQNHRGGFGDLDQTERMKLFVELADLAHYEARSQTAKRCQQVAEKAVERLSAQLAELRRDASDQTLAAVTSSLERVDASATEVGSTIERERAAVAVLDAARETAAASVDAYWTACAARDAARAALDRIVASVDEETRLLARLDPALAAEEQKISARYAAAIAAIDGRQKVAVDAHVAALKNWQERIAGNRVVLDRSDAIRSAAARLTAIAAERDDARVRRSAIATEIAGLKSARVEAETDLAKATAAREKLAEVSVRASLLTTVKFGEQCAIDPACPLVLDAVKARDDAAALTSPAARVEAVSARIATLTTQILDAEGRDAVIVSAEAALVKEAKSLAADASLAPHVEFATEKIAEYERDAAAARLAHATALEGFDVERRAAAESKDAETAAERLTTSTSRRAADERLASLTVDRATATAALLPADAEVERLASTKEALTRAERELTAARERLTKAEIEMAHIASERKALVASRASLSAKIARAASVEVRIRTIEDEGLAWQTLARACGKDGLQRLEIDASGPVVSDLANQLLRVGFGTRFSVDIVTQVATADGKDTKEKFTILVLDNEHGGETRDIGDLSGGEKVIVEEAVRAAIACYVNIRSRRRVRTLWRDETTGALDPENAARYVAMLRKMQELSGADQVLFITHSDACAALADAQIRVSAGTATVALPPFASSWRDDRRDEARS